MGIVRLALVVIGGWCVLHAMAATAVSGASAAGGKPNIVFIISDDQTFEGVGAYGNIEVKTPAIDRLAGRGAVFTHVYNMGSYSAAVCIASRTMLNTGQYVWRAQKLKLGQEREGMWSRRMSRAGYRTYMTGKWHVPIEPERVFDVVRTPRGGMPKSGPEAYNRPMDNEPDVWSPYDTSRGGFWTGGKHWSEVVADEAQVMLTEAAGRPEPFFMYIAFNAPHDPRQSPKEFVDMYPAKDIQVPPNFQP
jgi:choline-sulfatase